MNNNQITALAREYAEEKGRVMEQKQSLPSCLVKEVMEMDATELTRFLQWLSRRYCLVEKSKVEQMYKEAVDGKCELEKMQPQNTYAKNSILMKIGMNAGCAYTLKSLFPAIAKEVES